jgi:folate-dependent phosphoribosylglycinamide formyltransferase PurN
MLNIHPSLLPKYPGLHTHARALAAGDAQAGCTVHEVTAELDAGPILGQARVPVLPGDTEDTPCRPRAGDGTPALPRGPAPLCRAATARPCC